MEGGILIGEVCRRADCTPRTVRHYESEGLVFPAAKTAGGRKLYGQESISVIRTAQLFKRLGWSLKEIRHIIDLTKSRNTRHRQLTKKLRKKFNIGSFTATCTGSGEFQERSLELTSFYAIFFTAPQDIVWERIKEFSIDSFSCFSFLFNRLH